MRFRITKGLPDRLGAVAGAGGVNFAVFSAHATQIDPEERFWFGLSDENAESAYPYEDYELADSRVPTTVPEDDLFAGVRDGVPS